MSNKVRALKLLTEKPALGWSKAEWEHCLKLVKGMVSKGGTVILGDKRCFICGTEIDPDVTEFTVAGKGRPRFIVNLCDKCSKVFGEQLTPRGYG